MSEIDRKQFNDSRKEKRSVQNRRQPKKHSKSRSKSSKKYNRSPRSSLSISISVSKSSSSVSSSKSRSRSKQRVINRYRPKNHENQVLVLDGISEDVSKYQLEMILNESAVETSVNPHDEINLLQAFGIAYVKYPNVESARKVLFHLKGMISIGEFNIPMDFYEEQISDNRRKKDMIYTVTSSGLKQVELKNSLMNQPPATSYDWICDKCQYENFAKIKEVKMQQVSQCKKHQLQNLISIDHTTQYKYVYSKVQILINFLLSMSRAIESQDTSFNTSLMIRGKSIIDATESEILDIFQAISPVKDIRMVPNKLTGGTKDFAFVEFFTMEDSENVFRRVTNGEFKIRGEQITIQYSKSNRNQRFFEDQVAQQQYNQQQAAASHSGVGDLPSQASYLDQQFQQQCLAQTQFSQQQFYYQQQQQQQQQQMYSQQFQQNYQQQCQMNYQQYGYQSYQQPFQAFSNLPQMTTTQNISQFQTEQVVWQQQQISTQPMILSSPSNTQIVTPPPPAKSIQTKIEIKQQPKILEQPKQEKKNLPKHKEIQIEISQPPIGIQEEDDPAPKVHKEIDARKKVEQDLKKWQKQQQAALANPSIDKAFPLKQVQTSVKTNDQNKPEVQRITTCQTPVHILIICPICRRKFQSEEIQSLHEQFSHIHRDNLIKRGCV